MIGAQKEAGRIDPKKAFIVYNAIRTPDGKVKESLEKRSDMYKMENIGKYFIGGENGSLIRNFPIPDYEELALDSLSSFKKIRIKTNRMYRVKNINMRLCNISNKELIEIYLYYTGREYHMDFLEDPIDILFTKELRYRIKYGIFKGKI